MIKPTSRYLEAVRTRNVTEKQLVQYYDRCFDACEMDAVQWLMEQAGDSVWFIKHG